MSLSLSHTTLATNMFSTAHVSAEFASISSYTLMGVFAMWLGHISR